MPNEAVERFLKIISMLESSGDENKDHPAVTSGIHAGDSAIGQYGLMPNTIEEIAKRRPDLPAYDETSPEIQSAYANALAERTLSRSAGDEEKAAYAWRMGHNLTPEQITERGFGEHPYVQKYKEYKEKMFPKIRKVYGK